MINNLPWRQCAVANEFGVAAAPRAGFSAGLIPRVTGAANGSRHRTAISSGLIEKLQSHGAVGGRRSRFQRRRNERRLDNFFAAGARRFGGFRMRLDAVRTLRRYRDRDGNELAVFLRYRAVFPPDRVIQARATR